jgi:hypothetical protein
LKTLRVYPHLPEAHFAQSLLESHGIPAVLEHEASAVLAPPGAGAARLVVPDKHAAAAELILAEHPVHFSGASLDAPTFGFWRGALVGLVAYLCLSGLLLLFSGSSYFCFVLLFIFCSSAGVGGASYCPKKSRPKAHSET